MSPLQRVRPALGVLEWFELGERDRVERVLRGFRELGVERLRTGVSWANWYMHGGIEWYDWLLPRLARELEVLPCVVYTPPSLGLAPRTSSPPRRPRDYADFLDVLLTRYDGLFDHVELWNEPNCRAEWDWTLDPAWERFCEMVGAAAHWARRRGLRVVLGGMSPIDPNWLDLLGRRGVLDHVDVVGVHGFPGTWETAWDGWPAAVERVREALTPYAPGAEVWITEVGFSTWRNDRIGQLETFLDALEAPVSRVYWYAAEDLAPERPAIDRFHEDEREYHFGLRRSDGSPKLLARLWAEGGIPAVAEAAALAEQPRRRPRRPATLITGGAGFVGTNLADRLVREGRHVRILDDLSRPGVERNARWLRATHRERVSFELADVRDPFALRHALDGADSVFHLAAQVAVTTSLTDPLEDLGVNVQGTAILLEELRRLREPPPLVFTSTNKVYGALGDVELEQDGLRWEPVAQALRRRGVSEGRPLDFCTPYGCSKGAADQYVLDYAKTFGLPAAVFRMSCIYGPHQHGTEDQGWVAHFALRALAGEPIAIYGDGAQVRDLLYVDDLVAAFLLARERIDELAGTAFNVGGGPANARSLLEVLDLLEELNGEPPEIVLAEPRPGDQRWYVSDTRRLRAAVGWSPSVGVEDGLARLHEWLSPPVRRRVKAVSA